MYVCLYVCRYAQIFTRMLLSTGYVMLYLVTLSCGTAWLTSRSWHQLKRICPSTNWMVHEIIVSNLRIPSRESCSFLVLISSLVIAAYVVGGMRFTECLSVRWKQWTFPAFIIMTIILAFGMTPCLLFFMFNFLAKSREFHSVLE
jgi:hypothetical protein